MPLESRPTAHSYLYNLYSQVRLHERMLHEQAKKMNVKSLSANKEDAGKSVEIRIAKVAFTIFFLFICAWTPYAFVAMTGAFGDRCVVDLLICSFLLFITLFIQVFYLIKLQYN